jgi:hypothetical protein
MTEVSLACAKGRLIASIASELLISAHNHRVDLCLVRELLRAVSDFDSTAITL